MVDVVLALNLNNLEDHLETAKARASREGLRSIGYVPMCWQSCGLIISPPLV
jgi:hypothetical protein